MVWQLSACSCAERWASTAVGYQAYGTYVTCYRESKDEKEAHGKSALLDTVGMVEKAVARAFEAQVVGRLMGYGEEGEAKECGDVGGGKWSHARIR